MRMILIGLVTLYAGCFNVDPNLRFLCGDGSHDGFVCDGVENCEKNICFVPDGATPHDLGSPPDAAGDMAKPPTCVSVGLAGAPDKAKACAGKFGGLNPSTDTFCAQLAGAGCKTCTSGLNIQLDKVDALTGFFGIDAVGDKNGAAVSCVPGINTLLVFGAGGRSNSAIVAANCAGTKKAISCDGSAGWRCPVQSLVTASNGSPMDGLICCCP